MTCVLQRGRRGTGGCKALVRARLTALSLDSSLKTD